jgi:hypothetical protein
MKTRILWMAGLGILLAQGVLLAQTQNPLAKPGGELSKVEEPRIVKIVAVEHRPVRELINLIIPLFDNRQVNIVLDEKTNRLIVRATREHLDEVLDLVKDFDVATVAAPQNPPLLCRVYMLEIPPRESNLKPFAVVLRPSLRVASPEILSATKGDDLRIGRVLQNTEGVPQGEQQILIKGLAVSNESVRRMIEAIPESQIVDLKWDDDTFTAGVPAAQVAQLPESLQQHIREFLGADVRTVGYWFGNLSSPGEVMAPIGLWTMDLTTKSAQAPDLLLNIQVIHNRQYRLDEEAVVLRNTVQARIGKPIIIGYNRDVYGTRTMGAMVILLEADAAQPADAQTRAPK